MSRGVIVLILVVIYALICLFITLRARVSESSKDAYFVGGRSFGAILTVCTVVMGIYSGLTFYGFPGTIMSGGIFPLAATGFGFVGIAYPLVGYRLWKISKGKGFITMGDYMSARYNSPAVGLLTTLIGLVFIIPYMTVQFVSVGNGLSYSSDGFMGYEAALIFYAVLTVVYLIIGGAKGTSTLDIFNTALAVVVPAVAIVIIIGRVFGGSWSAMGTQALANFPDLMNASAFGATYSPLNILGLALSGMVCLFSAPHIVSKFFMAKDVKTFKKMTWMGPILYTALTIPIVVMGILGIAMYKPTLEATDLVVPMMMMEHTPTIVAVLMLCVLMAYAMSTTNGFCFAAATIFSNDIVMKLGKGNRAENNDKRIILWGKIGVVIIVVLTVLLSLTRPTAIVTYAYTFATPGFGQLLPAFLLGMYWKGATKEGALAGMICGLITLIITLWVIVKPFGIHPVIWSLGVNLLVFVVVSWITKPNMDTVAVFFED